MMTRPATRRIAGGYAVPPSTDLLIVGAGPSGLALAAELRRRGVASLIIDRQLAGANTSRACVVHARTLEVLEPLGVTGDLLAEGLKVPIFRIRDRDHALMTIDFSRIASPYSFTLMIPQNRVELHLERHLQELAGSVMRPAELVGCAASSEGIEAQVRVGQETRAVRARWLIGADGMHSAVRERMNIAFAGAPYEQSFVLADVRMDWPLSRDEVSLFYSPEGLVVGGAGPQQTK
jgi:2-polyprenyl-6-methoxyphenol hydroxylase-like FAD-dependent oxidoreductase